jgi:pimeloyl-ACP methyl ester carboxylesterase
VRAVVLDGVAPPDWTLGATAGRDAQRALDFQLARCAGDAECNRAFPDLPAQLHALLANQDAPAPIHLSDPTTGEPTSLPLGRDTLASVVRGLSYASEGSALLPLLIHTAHTTGDLRPFAAQFLMVSEWMKLSAGTHLAVACSEDAPFLDPARFEADNAGTYTGAFSARFYTLACKAWPKANVTLEDRAPVSSNVPVLLLSGEADPVTPPSNAAAAARTLPNSLQITVPGEGHVVLTRSCTRHIVEDFVERASVQGLSSECLKDGKPMPFFTSFKGPQP